MLTNALLYVGLLPLIGSATIAFIMRRMLAPLPIVWPVAIACGFLTAQFALRSQTGISDSLHTFIEPHEAVDWLPHIVLLALGVTVVTYLAPSGRRRLIALATAFCLAAPVRLLSGNVANHWSIPQKFAWLALLAAVLGVVWLLLASKDGERPAILRVPLLILVAVGTAIVLTQSGVLVYGLSCGALGAAITGTALAFLRATGFAGALGATGSASALGRPSLPGTEGAAAIITFTLGSLIILGHFYAELTTTNAALLFLSLAATAAPPPTLLRSSPAWQRNTGRITCCLLPLAIAVLSVVT
jgi:hypothetical protein